ncbi:uncharacterized protein BKCO1_5000124 [Diplodia corticola]|uniref:Uncharacterized protein n=1 Tax=Diplodia corticola TaxID=236234 RepID=A0A1J9RZE9_9PEZI|nr:uncharacterized protein BKCO1_5000124 [Diplodia corticola]OJD38051.1 hypothetical protein BKCO1_5000124 [Diplodia corticola]
MQSHNDPTSPDSPWRPLNSQQSIRSNLAFVRAKRFEMDITKRHARDRRAALAADLECTAPCIVEYHPPDSESDDTNDKQPSFLGWFPLPRTSENKDDEDDDCLQFRIGLDLPARRRRHHRPGDDWSDSDDLDPSSDSDSDGWDDADVDDDLDNAKCPAPLLWLRFPLRTLAPPAGLPAAAAAAARAELVHLAMPAHLFLPRSGSNLSSSHHHPHAVAPTPILKLTRYITNPKQPQFQLPSYVIAAAQRANIPLRFLCAIDIALHPSRTTGALPFLPARWMRLASAVENVLRAELEDVARGMSGSTGTGSVRVYTVWSEQLEGAVGRVAGMLGVGNGVNGIGREMGRPMEGAVVRKRVGRAKGMVVRAWGEGMQEGERWKEGKRRQMLRRVPVPVAVGQAGWGNFVEWTPRTSGGVVGKEVCGHMLSSTVERLGLVLVEGSESDDDESDDGEAMAVVVEENPKKRKVGHGKGVERASVKAIKGGKAAEKAKNGKA